MYSGVTPKKNGKRILILDDDPSLRHLMWYALRRDGHRVAVAHHPKEAEERLRKECFDLLVTDHHMPYETGLSFVRRIRQAKQKHFVPHQNMPVIMISSYNQPEHIHDLMTIGVGALLQKPFRIRDFTQAVRELTTHGNDSQFRYVKSLA